MTVETELDRPLRCLDRLRSAVGCRFVVKPEYIAGRNADPEGLLDFALWSGNDDPRFYPGPIDASLTAPPTWLAGIVGPHAGAQALYSGNAARRIEYVDRTPNPPTTDSGSPMHWLDGMRAFLAGIGFDYWEEPPLGDRYVVDGVVTDVEVKYSDRFGQFAVVHSEVNYRASTGMHFATGRGSVIAYEVANIGGRDGGSKATKDLAVDTTPVSSTAAQEGVRQAVTLRSRFEWTRDWDDVHIGDSFVTAPRGPLTHGQIAAFFVSPGRSPRADDEIRHARSLLAAGRVAEARSAYQVIAENPDYDFGLPRHTNSGDARSEGAPGAYDVGLQRAAWAAQAITDWAGSDARLITYWIEIRGFVVVGDSTTITATVVERAAIDARGGRVRVDLSVRNQRGRVVANGYAIVELPRGSDDHDQTADGPAQKN